MTEHRTGTGPAAGVSTFRRSGLVVSVAAAGLLAAAFGLAAVRLSLENQLLLGSSALALLYGLGLFRRTLPGAGRVGVILVGAFITLRYWLFRTTDTLACTGAWDIVFLVLLYLAETYGILIHFMGMFVNISPLTRRIPRLPKDERLLPTVDVFIPTYDEDVDILYTTVSACTQLDYPAEKLNVYILDDGGTGQKLNDPDPGRAGAARARAENLKSVARRLGATYLAREDNRNAKAGNLNKGILSCACGEQPQGPDKSACMNTGFRRSCGDLILILDCDHVPTRDFLQSTVGFFLEDERLFLVQTPHFFINPTPVEKNLDTHGRSPNENEMFYGAVQLGLDFWNASFFCGSAALLRRRHLLEIGGIAGDTVTEDAETSLLLHSRGYNSVYLNKPMIMGLSPETFDDFILQRSRWAQGMTQILLLKNPLRRRGLSIGQRLCYFNSCLFWLFGLARIVFFISPLVFLFFGMRVYNASFGQIAAYALPHVMASYFVANYLYGRLRHPFFSELFETIQSIFLAPAVVSVFRNPRRPRFTVTPKTISREKDTLTPLSAPFYVMLLLAVGGYAWGAWRWATDPMLWDTVLVCAAWNTFNLLMVLCCLGVVWERRQLRRSHRYETREPVSLRLPGSDECLAAVLTDISTSGVGMEIEGVTDIPSDRLVLEARDGGGRLHVLPLRVTRRKEKTAGMSLGCEFEQPHDVDRRRVVGFVYGDSNRWKYFYEANIARGINSYKGFLNLLLIGAKGSVRNLAGIVSIFLDFLRHMGLTFYNSIKIERRGKRRDETIEGAADSTAGHDPAARSGLRDQFADTTGEAGPGAGPPAQGLDGQLQLHHPRPGALESRQRHTPFQLR
jgi:cellulose synthase (UDP-forming)